MKKLHLDTETRSLSNLELTGMYRYGTDPSTEIILLSYAINDEKVKTWFCLENEKIPEDLETAFLNKETLLFAHNSSFDRVMILTSFCRKQRLFSKETLKELKDLNRWRCTAAMAAYMNLPRSLDGAARALRLSFRKDEEGAVLMKRLCSTKSFSKETGQPIWNYSAADALRLAAYCECDVEVERQLSRYLRPLSDIEQRVWACTERLNDYGLHIDVPLLNMLEPFVAASAMGINRKLSEITNGVITSPNQHIRFRKWLTGQSFPDTDEYGNPIGAGKEVIEGLLEREDLLPHVREILLLRRDGGKTGTAKIKRMREKMDKDDVVRGNLLYCGASSTHRFSGKCGFQAQNLIRGGTVGDMPKLLKEMMGGITPEEVKEKYAKIDKKGDLVPGSPFTLAGELMRPLISARSGFWLARGDLSQIELRMNAWLCGEQKTLKAFSDYDTILGTNEKGKPIRKGSDIYKISAASMRGIKPEEVTDDIRQEGKIACLALGFHGSVGALRSMAKKCNTKIHDEEKLQKLLDEYKSCFSSDKTVMTYREAGKMFSKYRFDESRSENYISVFELSEAFINDAAQTIVDQFRSANPMIIDFGRALMSAMIQCVKGGPGIKYYTKHYDKDANHGDRYTGAVRRRDLWFIKNDKCCCLRLPSGGYLHYWYPEMRKKKTLFKDLDEVLVYQGVGKTGMLFEFDMWSGIILENSVQSLAYEAMAYAFTKASAIKGVHPCLMVHDELVCEMSKKDFPTKESALKGIQSIMSFKPDWLSSMPLSAECSVSDRYWKI